MLRKSKLVSIALRLSILVTMLFVSVVLASAQKPTLSIVAGDGQNTIINNALAIPLKVLVTDSSGTPQAEATVTFTVPTTGATLNVMTLIQQTGADGIAQVTGTAN